MQKLKRVDPNTRLFFVVDSLEDNEEIFETFGEAKRWYSALRKGAKPRIRVCFVKNAYIKEFREGEEMTKGNKWNYDDYSDTFETILTVL